VTDFIKEIATKPLVCYGAVGTMLIQRGFDLTTCLGKWLIDNPDHLKWLTHKYVDAGCRVIGSGGSQSGPWKLKTWGLENRIIEINSKVTSIIKEIIPEDCYITGTILPTGKLLKPMGDLDPNDLDKAYQQETEGYAKGGADVIWVMTMMDIDEACIAVKAARKSVDLPIMASMAFDVTKKGIYTMMGVDPKTAAKRLVEAGADIVGHNCGNAAPDEITPILEQMREVTNRPLVAKPNAGIPEVIDGETCWQSTPDQYAENAVKWINAGAKIVGGCCGSTPEHAAQIRKALDTQMIH